MATVPDPHHRALRADLQVRVLVDQAGLKRIDQGVRLAARKGAERAAAGIARRGAQMLSMLDKGAGRSFLAGLWTTTEPFQRADGRIVVEVYNKAEDMTILTRSNAPGSNKVYPIPGKSLLSILNYGARPHTIRARSPKTDLQFPAVIGISQSRHLGTVVTREGIGRGEFKGGRGTSIISVQSVKHPGVTGSRFLQVARRRLEGTLGREASEAARSIAVDVQQAP